MLGVQGPPGAKSRSVAAATTITLVVRVVDWKTKQPLAGCKVTNVGRSISEDITTPGFFRVTNVQPDDTVPIRVEAPGYRTLNEVLVRIPYDKAVVETEIAMGPGGTIIGRVVGGIQDTPQTGVTVSLSSEADAGEYAHGKITATTKSGPDGTFRFEHVPPGSGEVTVPGEGGREGKRMFFLKHEQVWNAMDINPAVPSPGYGYFPGLSPSPFGFDTTGPLTTYPGLAAPAPK
jgi:hypothetical protein